ncbi:MAG: hypothetical protein M0002_03900 [Rhodospirillales bacterium]|nr:hypothetical protein [Rhodospirillales bacterium]
MPNEIPKDVLSPATAEEIRDSLSFALRYEGRKRVHQADEVMARITAERLVQHLERSGYVLMKRPAAAAPTTRGFPGRDDER